MVPKKMFTLTLALIAMAAGLAGCAAPEEESQNDIDADPGAGEVPFDDTNDDLTTDDEDLGDEGGVGNESGETNETGSGNETAETNETPA